MIRRLMIIYYRNKLKIQVYLLRRKKLTQEERTYLLFRFMRNIKLNISDIELDTIEGVINEESGLRNLANILGLSSHELAVKIRNKIKKESSNPGGR